MHETVLERLEKEVVDEQWNRYYEDMEISHYKP